MKVRHTRGWKNDGPVLDLADAVRAMVFDTNCEGALENVGERIENMSSFVGRLVSVLEKKGLLREDEIIEVLGYGFEAVEDEA